MYISMLHTLSSTGKNLRTNRLQRHGRNVGSDVGYVGFQFIQIAPVIPTGIVFNISP
jgi:hypothetical protein